MLWALIPILGILAVFGVPAYLFKRYFDLRERQLRLQGEADANLIREIEGLRARIEVLESIVVEGDYELNRKLGALDRDRETDETNDERRRLIAERDDRRSR